MNSVRAYFRYPNGHNKRLTCILTSWSMPIHGVLASSISISYVTPWSTHPLLTSGTSPQLQDIVPLPCVGSLMLLCCQEKELGACVVVVPISGNPYLLFCNPYLLYFPLFLSLSTPCPPSIPLHLLSLSPPHFLSFPLLSPRSLLPRCL